MQYLFNGGVIWTLDEASNFFMEIWVTFVGDVIWIYANIFFVSFWDVEEQMFGEVIWILAVVGWNRNFFVNMYILFYQSIYSME